MAYTLLALIDRLVRATALYCGGIVLAALMVVTVFDVTFRYVIGQPIGGSYDYSIMALVLVVACSIPYGARTGAHVTADLFTHLTGPRADRVIGIAVKLFLACVTAIWAWRLFLSGRTATRLGEATLLTNIPFEPFYQALALGIALYSVVLLLEAFSFAFMGSAPLHPDVAGSNGSGE